jgi:hypothetical protein
MLLTGPVSLIIVTNPNVTRALEINDNESKITIDFSHTHW